MRDASTRRQIVTFSLGEHHFAAEVAEVERVLVYSPPGPVPELPPWVAGIVEYAGSALPLIDLRARFELPPADGGIERRVIVLGAGGTRVGAVVDRVHDVASVPASSWDEPPPLFRGLAADYLHGVVRRDGRVIMVLNAARLVSAVERIVLEREDG